MTMQPIINQGGGATPIAAGPFRIAKQPIDLSAGSTLREMKIVRVQAGLPVVVDFADTTGSVSGTATGFLQYTAPDSVTLQPGRYRYWVRFKLDGWVKWYVSGPRDFTVDAVPR